MNKTVSLIVPTHNRCYSLIRLLDMFENQTYPLNMLEVIIVADGCIDKTVALLKEHNASYSLRYIEQDGHGAATARNSGAQSANGEILIFLDDDIEPCNDLIMAHVQAHINENTVVIGYLPMDMPKKATLLQISLANYWEQKYSLMADPYYRFGYSDLLSGNFSVSAELFKKVNHFDSEFRCREDYELGARLIRAGAEFVFSKNAWGLHRDESNTLERSFQRKRDEGKADVLFASKHPALFPLLTLSAYSNKTGLGRKLLFGSAFNKAPVTDRIALSMTAVLRFLERHKQRSYYQRLNGKLQKYWYLRGISDAVKTKKNWDDFIQQFKPSLEPLSINIQLDLKQGLPHAVKQLDDLRPDSVSIHFGNHFIGEIFARPGYERLKGKHLHRILLHEFPHTLVQALMIERVINDQIFYGYNGN